MREIKFRFWEADMREMHEVSQITFADNTTLSGSGVMDSHNDMHSFTDGTLMEFTGLKDNAGNEVWEGDVLETTQYSPRFWTVEFLDGQFCGVWRYEDGTIDARDLVDRLLYDGATVHHNIYEQQKEATA